MKWGGRAYMVTGASVTERTGVKYGGESGGGEGKEG